jgi:hypothetical protein
MVLVFGLYVDLSAVASRLPESAAQSRKAGYRPE